MPRLDRDPALEAGPDCLGLAFTLVWQTLIAAENELMEEVAANRLLEAWRMDWETCIQHWREQLEEGRCDGEQQQEQVEDNPIPEGEKTAKEVMITGELEARLYHAQPSMLVTS
ncbi:hypothetical protein AX15_007136 [Amanita polypyramis BW_CC]|nr:hypothetical protein AX15_007136 [Amanita polypyramis BW_CC]